MREAVIVSTARTPIGKAYRGAFNATPSPTLAAHAIRAGLVDEIHLLVNPIIVGGGKAALPDDVRLRLELLDEHRFANGVVHLHYGAQTSE